MKAARIALAIAATTAIGLAAAGMMLVLLGWLTGELVLGTLHSHAGMAVPIGPGAYP